MTGRRRPVQGISEEPASPRRCFGQQAQAVRGPGDPSSGQSPIPPGSLGPRPLSAWGPVSPRLCLPPMRVVLALTRLRWHGPPCPPARPLPSRGPQAELLVRDAPALAPSPSSCGRLSLQWTRLHLGPLCPGFGCKGRVRNTRALPARGSGEDWSLGVQGADSSSACPRGGVSPQRSPRISTETCHQLTRGFT